MKMLIVSLLISLMFMGLLVLGLNDRIATLERKCDSEYIRGMNGAMVITASAFAQAYTNDTRSAFEKEVSP